MKRNLCFCFSLVFSAFFFSFAAKFLSFVCKQILCCQTKITGRVLFVVKQFVALSEIFREFCGKLENSKKFSES